MHATQLLVTRNSGGVGVQHDDELREDVVDASISLNMYNIYY